MTSKMTTKTLRGKYQLSKNTYVACYLDVVEATDKEIHTFVGLKKRADGVVPNGARIYFDAEMINKINVRRSNTFDIFSVTVLFTRPSNGKTLHICSPINKETHGNLRETERQPMGVHAVLNEAQFTVTDATRQGLTLLYTSKKSIMSLVVNHHYELLIQYKDESYPFPVEIKHVQYDWRSHEHVIGVQFGELSEDQQTILTLLLDPRFSIDLSGPQTVDTHQGKVSKLDLDIKMDD